ncbi:C4-dicarboxylate TRAP transporter substrate-binding protein [Paracoccus pacificus]|uniref:TRAP transporter substrate-binding protein DctP n=1 Tax=Paracoccus pacificus TaxID=1463598 RepID=A0ABW4R2U3_9RHOB
MKRREFLAYGAGLGASGLLMSRGRPAFAATSLKFDSYVSETAGPSWVDRWFLEELEKRTNGEVSIRSYWSGSLNKVGEHLAAVRDGTSEITLISPGYYQAEVPVTRGLEWYFRMNRSDALQQVCHDVYNQFQPLRDEWEQRHRSQVLYWTTWNYAPLVMREPITSLEQIKGKRIRGYGVATDVIERLGGIPVPMTAPEVYQSLERGVLDGVYGFDFITAVAYKLHEVAPNFYDIGDGPHGPATVVMNKQVYDGLDEQVRQTITDLSDELYAGKFAEIYNGALTEYVSIAKNEGVKFATFPEEELAAARAAVQPAEVQAWIDTVATPAGIDGAEMQRLIDEAIAKHDPNGKMLRPSEIAESI